MIVTVNDTDNMDRFPTNAHISSWAGICPENNESSHKRKPGKTRKENALLRKTLVICAHSTVKGTNYYNQFNKERNINVYLKILKTLGWKAPVVAA